MGAPTGEPLVPEFPVEPPSGGGGGSAMLLKTDKLEQMNIRNSFFIRVKNLSKNDLLDHDFFGYQSIIYKD